MTQSTKSETQKQIEWEIAIQDALEEVFKDESQNPCREIPLEANAQNDFNRFCSKESGFFLKGTETGRTSSDKSNMSEVNKTIFKRYGVSNKKELFRKLYSYDGESWEAMCERIAKQASEMSKMDFKELETKVIVTFITLLQKIREEHEKSATEIDPDAE